ncbi:glycosyltransferase family 2 protein [Sphingomonas sp. NSE70-1]|uniref:Glycosyltransferase family 2 protein n=1 Tax=Sphingomonas caseinilyticus TaxID=2908205 RepID=A0ABT0RQK1_9SPHN|nr:glycosyltransferase family 2 protein [Sphingomonas caseinilyticus]
MGASESPSFLRGQAQLALRIWLTLRVHADGFRANPYAYIQAAGWRLRGLKVRSRNRIAPLAGSSPHAYELWKARKQSAPSPQPAAPAERALPKILPIVDCRSGSAIEDTLISIAGAGNAAQPILIGGPPLPGSFQVACPDQLRQHLLPQGSWICPMASGDLLAPGAFDAYSAAILSSPEAGVIYADDDLILQSGESGRPHFKPQWNRDLFDHHDYITGASVLRVRPETFASWPSDGWVDALLGEILKSGPAPVHLPLMLHHRCSRPAPIIPLLHAEPLGEAPVVSAIIPTRNHFRLLRHCIEGVERADYPTVEIIVIDNDSDDPETLAYLKQLEFAGYKVLRRPGRFNFSVLNNDAVRQASGSMLCFLNNDVEMIDRNWLTPLVRQAIRPQIGAVGAMLLYPDHTIQHAGVYLGIGGGAGHAHRFLPDEDPGYFNRARLPQLVSAVTAACMTVDREKFLQVEGFDESLFPVAFNDVDLCLKLNRRGWQSFYEPRSRLIHHESKSRGSDSARPNRARFAGELQALKAKWHTDQHRDPFHHPELSPFSEQFVVAI